MIPLYNSYLWNGRYIDLSTFWNIHALVNFFIINKLIYIVGWKQVYSNQTSCHKKAFYEETCNLRTKMSWTEEYLT